MRCVCAGETLADCAERELREETGLALVHARDPGAEGFSNSLAFPTPFAACDALTHDAEGRLQYHYAIIDVSFDWVAGGLPRPASGCRHAWAYTEEATVHALCRAYVRALACPCPPCFCMGLDRCAARTAVCREHALTSGRARIAPRRACIRAGPCRWWSVHWLCRKQPLACTRFWPACLHFCVGQLCVSLWRPYGTRAACTWLPALLRMRACVCGVKVAAVAADPGALPHPSDDVSDARYVRVSALRAWQRECPPLWPCPRPRRVHDWCTLREKRRVADTRIRVCGC